MLKVRENSIDLSFGVVRRLWCVEKPIWHTGYPRGCGHILFQPLSISNTSTQKTHLQRQPVNKAFNAPLDSSLLDLDEKKRANLLTWRGQFSPEFIENLLVAYAESNDVVLDPFCGSGTLLYECGRLGLEGVGVELNPAAYNLSKVYEFMNIDLYQRKKHLRAFHLILSERFDFSTLLAAPREVAYEENEIIEFVEQLSSGTETEDQFLSILCHCLITIIDFDGFAVKNTRIEKCYLKLEKLVLELPRAERNVNVFNYDCRNLPLESDSVDFVLTSPPYINVFNYHQNYRKSTELLGWDVLNVAKSEIGSNRANRGNRFLTVVQYVNDLAQCLNEIYRVLKSRGKCLFVVGHESTVLGCRFFNAEIIRDLASELGEFDIVQNQSRFFKNKFGANIREDLIHMVSKDNGSCSPEILQKVCFKISSRHLKRALNGAPEKNRKLLESAIEKSALVFGTTIYKGLEGNDNRAFSSTSLEEA